MPTIPSTSREYLTVPDISGVDDTGSLVDPTALTVEFAFLPAGTDPQEADWNVGGWEPGTLSATARILIGPGGVTAPPVGDYKVWLRVTGMVERPTRVVGDLSVV